MDGLKKFHSRFITYLSFVVPESAQWRDRLDCGTMGHGSTRHNANDRKSKNEKVLCQCYTRNTEDVNTHELRRDQKNMRLVGADHYYHWHRGKEKNSNKEKYMIR